MTVHCTSRQVNNCHAVSTAGIFDKHSYLQQLISSWHVKKYWRLPWLAWPFPTICGKRTGGQYLHKCTVSWTCQLSTSETFVWNMWVPVFFLRGKAVGAWSWSPPPTSADVKNEWSYAASPPKCLYGADRDNFTLKPKMSDQKTEKIFSYFRHIQKFRTKNYAPTPRLKSPDGCMFSIVRLSD